MSHVTRMGPAPAPTQILSIAPMRGKSDSNHSIVIPSAARNLLFAGGIYAAGKQQVPQRLTLFRNDKVYWGAFKQRPRRFSFMRMSTLYTSHKSAAFRRDSSGSPVGTNSWAT